MTTTGVLGSSWRATVSPWGAIEPWDGSAVLDWHIAADDRWHSPQHEAAVRQQRVDGTAVVATRVRVPDGDVVHTVYSVPDHGGLTVIEVTNESPLPVVIAFTHGRLLSTRPPSTTIEGIELPAGSVAFPVGHRATLTVALPHGDRAGLLPERIPTAASVVRGWMTLIDRAGRLVLPDEAITRRIAAHRCEVALCGPASIDDDPVAFLLGASTMVRMGIDPTPWVADVAAAAERALRDRRPTWDVAAALDGAAVIFARADERRAARDLAAARRRAALPSPLPGDEPIDDARAVAWNERRCVSSQSGGAVLLPYGLPTAWLGANVEVYDMPVVGGDGDCSAVSFALRWHGERPAVLWEQQQPAVELSSPMAPDWRVSSERGEALWPAPAVNPIV